MLRDKSLIPLSHQHQHALALCVRIDRAGRIPESALAAWQAEVAEHFRSEISVHFAAEEKVLFPEARRFSDLVPLVEELLSEHAALRSDFAQAEVGRLTSDELSMFAARLSAHVRKEERQLFERMQEWMGAEELADLGKRLEAALEDAVQTCSLPANRTAI